MSVQSPKVNSGEIPGGRVKLRVICKSKIHHAVVTAADLKCVGSVGIDESLMRLTGIAEGEQVSLWNINNGQRIETYAIPFPAGTGPDLALSEMRLTPLRLRPSANPCSSDTSDARV